MNMTINQAVAILEAERVLQSVGCGGPDIENGSAWTAYVKEAGRVTQSDPLFRDQFEDLVLLGDVRARSLFCRENRGLWRTGMNMTIYQALAILQAERVLQRVECDGPDISGDSAWAAYVKEASRVVRSDPLFRDQFNDLALLIECPCGEDCDGTGDSEGLCKCRD